ncbi:hypothetical protein AAGS40_23340 [Paraburkholderia sp. PREW-6R]|uniref:hypothetical protein n=1 Tax=Paraburkholderia sp. PREW-6R TaxID=3141544 RepID=UPI0031F4C360
MNSWILVVVSMSYAAGGAQHASIAMQEFLTQRACGRAADYIRDQMRVESKAQSGLIEPKFDIECLPKAVSQ